jgi:hypothetical protein
VERLSGILGGREAWKQHDDYVCLPALEAVDCGQLEARIEAPESVLRASVLIGVLHAEAAQVDPGVLEPAFEIQPFFVGGNEDGNLARVRPLQDVGTRRRDEAPAQLSPGGAVLPGPLHGCPESLRVGALLEVHRELRRLFQLGRRGPLAQPSAGGNVQGRKERRGDAGRAFQRGFCWRLREEI